MYGRVGSEREMICIIHLESWFSFDVRRSVLGGFASTVIAMLAAALAYVVCYLGSFSPAWILW